MSKLSERGLSWPMIEEIAAHTGCKNPRSVYNVACGHKPWRHARTSIVRHLYQQGWKPPHDSKAAVRLWLYAKTRDAQREADALTRALTTPSH